MDGITWLRHEHRALEKLFRAFDRALDRGTQDRLLELARAIFQGLRQHSRRELDVFYPLLVQSGAVEEPVIRVAEEHHHVWDLLMTELQRMKASHPRFVPRVIVLIELAMDHMREEEEELFPDVRRALGRPLLLELGKVLEQARG